MTDEQVQMICDAIRNHSLIVAMQSLTIAVSAFAVSFMLHVGLSRKAR